MKMNGTSNWKKGKYQNNFLINKFNTILDSQDWLAPMAMKSSPLTSYSKVMQRHWLGDTACLSFISFFFFVWQILSVSVSTEYKVGLF